MQATCPSQKRLNVTSPAARANTYNCFLLPSFDIAQGPQACTRNTLERNSVSLSEASQQTTEYSSNDPRMKTVLASEVYLFDNKQL